VKDVMIDLETLGTKPYSAIISIGAVLFDIEQRTIDKEFYCLINLQSCTDYELTIDPKTVAWWAGQSDEARKALTAEPREPLYVALSQFADVFLDGDIKGVWGNGSDFDNVILSCAYERGGMEIPWKFHMNRCYRTVKGMHPNNKIVRMGTHHNALDDARSQAWHLMNLLNPPTG
jgi:hypothetical protein